MFYTPNQQLPQESCHMYKIDDHNFSAKNTSKKLSRHNVLKNGIDSKREIRTGCISIRRFFNDDNFLISYFSFQPYRKKVFGRCQGFAPNYNISINGKVISRDFLDKRKDDNRVHWGHAAKLYGENMLFPVANKIKKDLDIKLEYALISSKDLKMSFSDIKDITVTHYYEDGTPFYWRVKREEEKTNPKEINMTASRIGFSIPEFYNFKFSNYEDDVKKEKIDFSVWVDFDNKSDLNQITKTRKVATLEGKTNNSTTKDWTNAFYKFDYAKGNSENKSITDWERDSFKKTEKIGKILFKRQMLDSFGIRAFKSNALPDITSNDLTIKTIDDPTKTTQPIIKEISLNNFVEYDYEKGKIVNSTSEETPGLFIPYNFKGDLVNSYEFFINYNPKSESKGHKIIINRTRKIDKPLLDPYEGLVKLNLDEKRKSDYEDYKFIFRPENIKDLIGTKDDKTTELFEGFRK